MWSFPLFVAVFSEQIFSAAAEITDNDYALMPPLFRYDDYDQCMFHDQFAVYCAITFQLHPLHVSNASYVWRVIQNVSSNNKNYRHDILRHGICLAETCTEDLQDISDVGKRLTQCYRKTYSNKGLTGEIIKIRCEEKSSSHPVDHYDIVFGTFGVVYVIFVVVVTLSLELLKHVYKAEYEKIIIVKIVSTFSIFENWRRLFHVDFEANNIKSLRCIQGFRFYSIIISILLHTMLVHTSLPVSNPHFLEEALKTTFVFLGCAPIIIHNYFFISGFLLAFNSYLKYEKKGSIQFKQILSDLANRFMRLTPTLAVVIAFHSTWSVHYSRGPFWDQLIGEEYRRCRANWWTNLLFVNNLIKREQMCLIPSWFLATDTQYYIFGLTILWITYKKPRWLYAVSASVIVLHVAVLSFFSFWNQWEPIVYLTPELVYDLRVTRSQHWLGMYTSTYSGMGPFAIGFCLGYTFFNQRTISLFNNKIFVAVAWIAALSITFGTALLPALLRLYYKDNPLFAALYAGISGPLFTTGIALTLFALIHGKGWIVNWFCEGYPVYILGRLTYCAYLVHYLGLRVGAQRSPIFLREDTMFIDGITNITFAYISALVLTLFVEMPFCRLSQRLFKEKGRYLPVTTQNKTM